jgi:hypothetical protein
LSAGCRREGRHPATALKERRMRFDATEMTTYAELVKQAFSMAAPA